MNQTLPESIRTTPNYYRISAVLLLLIFVVLYTSFFGCLMYAIVVVENEELTAVVIAFLLNLLFIGITIAAFRSTSHKMNVIEVTETGIRIKYPMKFKSVFMHWDQIRGYSKSSYFYGGQLRLKSSSIVIYTNTNQIHEVIRIYNSGFDNLQKSLKDFPITCLGHEGFNTKTHKAFFMKRVYKYDKPETK
ncbi:MAG: hypothetical protein ACO1N0_10995 [Fluviicola sp.]